MEIEMEKDIEIEIEIERESRIEISATRLLNDTCKKSWCHSWC